MTTQGERRRGMGRWADRKRRRRADTRSWRRWQTSIEGLESRTLLSETLSMSSIAINLNTPGPTSISGVLNPGNELAAYRIDGTIGERLQFHSVSTSTTNGSWLLEGENNQEVAGTGLGSDFTANLTATGPYYLELVGNTTAAISYSFQVTDLTTYPPIASSGFDVTQSGTLAASTSKSFSFQAPAGLPIYFNNLGFGGSISATLTDPNNSTVFSYNPGSSGNTGPYVLTTSGAYTLKLANGSGSSQNYSFNMLSLPGAATSLALGPTQTVTGTLNPGLGTAVYSFLGAAQERIFLDNLTASGVSVNFVLIKPDDGQIFNIGANSDGGPLSLTESGTYYLLAIGSSSSPLNYGFRLTDTAYVPLTFGATTSGTVTTATQSDVSSFTGTAGERTYFEELSDSNGYYGAYWYLYGPNNQSITSNWIGGDLTATLPTSGTYTLVVDNNTSYSTATYSFVAIQNVDPTTSINLGQTVSGTINNPGDEATYTFTGSPGQRLFFNSLATPNGYVYAQLTDPNGNSIFNNSEEYNEGPYTLTYPGTYTLTVYSYTTTRATGSYGFVVDDVTAPTSSVALTAGAGTTVSGTLSSGLATNFYQLSGTAGERLYFEGQSDSASDAARYNLFNAANGNILNNWAESDGTVTLPYTGSYLLGVAGQNVSNTSVTYKFEVFENVDPTTALTLGTPVSGPSATIANPGDEATYTFTVSPGQRIYFDALGSYIANLNAVLTDPYVNTIFNHNASYDEGSYTLTYLGTYTLTVYSSGTSRATGNYAFEVLDESAQTLTPTATPAPVSGTLSPGTQASIYQITGTAGQTITLNSVSFSSTSGTWYLVDPNNRTVASAGFTHSFSATLALSGPYALIVQGNDTTDSSVSYSFDISATTPSSLTPSGFDAVQSGTLTAGKSTSFTFTGTAGLAVYLNSLVRTSQPITATLTDPNNNQIFLYSPSSNAGPYILTASGTYTLKLTNTSGSSSGSYDFNMLDLPAAATSLSFDTPVSGTLNPGATTLVYSFTGTPGQKLFLDNLTTVGNAVNLRLLDPYNNQVFNIGSSSDSGLFDVTNGGTYYLLVDGEASSPVGYGFRLIDPATVPLSFGTTTSGTVTTATQSDVYSFTGTAGERVYFEELSDSNGGGGASWYLYGPNNQGITSSGIGGDLAARLSINGTYTLAVYNNTSYATATYSFEAIQNVDPTTSINLGQTVSGMINNPGDEATYTFTITPAQIAAGQRIFVNGLDPYIGSLNAILTDPNGNTIYNSNAAYNEGPYSLTYPGTYTLTVYSNSTSRATGNYKFAVDDVTAPASSIALTSGAGTTVSGTLASGAAVNFYQLSGTAGERLYFESLSDSPSYSAEVNLVNLSNGSITSYYEDYDYTWTLPSTGTYLLYVSGTNVNNASVSYKFEVFENVDPTTSINLGQTVSGTIANPGDEATYTFTISPAQIAAGQRIFVNGLDPSIGSLNAILTDSNGNTIFNNNAAYNEGPYSLTYPGTYTLTAYSNSTSRATGNYKFAVDDVTAPASSIALTSGAGTTVSGTLASGAAVNFYQLSGTAGERLYFESLSDSPSYSAEVNLVNLSNGSITSNYEDYDYTWTLPSTGTYLLYVSGTNASNASVGYKFEVFDNVDPTASINLGQTVSGTIANPGDEATYTFTVTPAQIAAGQRIFVNGLDPSIGSLNAILTDPKGNTIFNNNAAYNEGPYSLTYPGTYTLTAYSSGTSRATGNYSFVVDDVTAPASSIALTSGAGTIVSGTLATGASDNFYQLSGTAGERLYFEGVSDSPSYSAQYYLYNAANGNILNNNWVESNRAVTLPYTGNYLLAVVGWYASNPSDSYKFEVFDNVDPTTPLALNSEVTGSLANPGDEATYTFTGSIGQQIQFNGLEPGTYQVATLYDPEGNSVFSSYLGQNNAGPYTLTTPGTYSLVLTTNGGSYTGNFDFRLLDLQSETKLQVNTTEADLTVTLLAPPAQQVLVQYATADGTATAAGGAYKPATGLLLFQPGQTTATVEVQALDQFTTGSTFLDVNLSNPVGAGATIASGGGTGVVTINASGQGTLNGEVYNDLNGNGTLDGGEPGLAGWTIDLLNSAQTVIATTTTDINGDYSFTGLAAGSYTVAEVLQSGYIETAPSAPGTYAVTIATGQTINYLNFGDFQPVTLSGTVYNDLNGSGTLNSSDPGLSGWTIDLLNGSSQVVQTASTNSQGYYAFNGVGPGSYTVEEVLKGGFVQTSSPANYLEKIANEQNVGGLDFGNFQLATFSGEVYNDLGGSGTFV